MSWWCLIVPPLVFYVLHLKRKLRHLSVTPVSQSLPAPIVPDETEEGRLSGDDLKAMFNGLQDAVVAIDMEKVVLHVNPAALSLFGKRLEEVKGASLYNLTRNAELHSLIENPETCTTVSGDLVVPQTEAKILHTVVSPYQNPRYGRVLLLVIRDVTQQRKLEALRREFVANVSHELKTPITSIRGYAETLMDGAMEDTEVAKPFMEKLLFHSVRLAEVIDDLLQLSRIEDMEKGGSGRAMTHEAIHPILQKVVDSLQKVAEDKQITLCWECPKNLSGSCNASLLMLALVNYVQNAINYSCDGAQVRIRTLAQDGRITISVQDEGPGIAKEDQQRIFERFYRVDRSRSRTMGGTGLGLSLVKHIAQLHGGKAWCESQLGKGSTFFLSW